MDAMGIVAILSRWAHVASACLLIGAAVAFSLLAPRAWDDPAAHRRFKTLLHALSALLILTGAFNAWWVWGAYHLAPGATHALFGIHLLLALAAIALAEAAASRRKLATLTLAAVIALAGVAAASTLKALREKAISTTPVPTAPIAGATP